MSSDDTNNQIYEKLPLQINEISDENNNFIQNEKDASIKIVETIACDDIETEDVPSNSTAVINEVHDDSPKDDEETTKNTSTSSNETTPNDESADNDIVDELTKQKLRDEAIRKKRQSLREDYLSLMTRSERLRMAYGLVSELENDGPAGLVHIAALHAALGKSIKIWDSKRDVKRIIGPEQDDYLEIEFHEPTESDGVGHWTLPDNEDPELEPGRNIKNDCLFRAIGAQIGKRPSALRTETVKRMKKNIERIADNIETILWFEKYDPIVLMTGGASYAGSGPNDAARILDNSQNVRPFGRGGPGHPRGHASNPGNTSPMGSVEMYSMTGQKTGFLSYSKQDLAGHHALTNHETVRAMDRLNEGAERQVITIPASHLNIPDLTAKEFYRGTAITSEQPVRQVKLIIMHHVDQYCKKDADVFVLTFYPQL